MEDGQRSKARALGEDRHAVIAVLRTDDLLLRRGERRDRYVAAVERKD